MEKGTKRTKEEQDQAPEEKDDPILDLAIEYVASGAYPAGIPKQKKRAVRKRAANLLVQDGEVFLQRKNRKVSIVGSEAIHIILQLTSYPCMACMPIAVHNIVLKLCSY